MHSRSPLASFAVESVPVPPRRLFPQASVALRFVGWSFAYAARPPVPIPVYFTAVERRFVEAATQRLIADGEDGLGARSAAVALETDALSGDLYFGFNRFRILKAESEARRARRFA